MHKVWKTQGGVTPRSSRRRPDFRVSVFITGQRGRRADALWDAALILPEISGIPAVAPHYSAAASVGDRAKRARGLFRARWPSLLLL